MRLIGVPGHGKRRLVAAAQGALASSQGEFTMKTIWRFLVGLKARFNAYVDQEMAEAKDNHLWWSIK
jgi:hypothetical protein